MFIRGFKPKNTQHPLKHYIVKLCSACMLSEREQLLLLLFFEGTSYTKEVLYFCKESVCQSKVILAKKNMQTKKQNNNYNKTPRKKKGEK